MSVAGAVRELSIVGVELLVCGTRSQHFNLFDFKRRLPLSISLYHSNCTEARDLQSSGVKTLAVKVSSNIFFANYCMTVVLNG